MVNLYTREGGDAVRAQYGAGPPLVEHIGRDLAGITAEERRLLGERQQTTARRTDAARYGFTALILFLALVLPVLYRRILSEIRQRERSQAELRRHG
jgi:hypothetical protein